MLLDLTKASKSQNVERDARLADLARRIERKEKQNGAAAQKPRALPQLSRVVFERGSGIPHTIRARGEHIRVRGLLTSDANRTGMDAYGAGAAQRTGAAGNL